MVLKTGAYILHEEMPAVNARASNAWVKCLIIYKPGMDRESFWSICILPLLIMFSKLISPVTVIRAFLLIPDVSGGNICDRSSLLNRTLIGKEVSFIPGIPWLISRFRMAIDFPF